MRRSDAGLAPSLPTAGMMNMRMAVVLVMMVFVVIMMMIIRIMMIILLEQELVAEDKPKPPPHFEENKLKSNFQENVRIEEYFKQKVVIACSLREFNRNVRRFHNFFGQRPDSS